MTPFRLPILAPLALLLLATSCSRSDARSRVVIQNKGSDTLVNVAQAWAENYKDVDGAVAVAVSGGGSGTGVAALLNGTVDIANSSRPLKDKEIEAARKKGIEPKQFIVGYDALAIFLHKDNPIESMTLKQLADIYGEDGPVDSWDQINIAVPGCASNEIVRVSRQNNSGTYECFKEYVLGSRRDFKLGSRDMHGSKDVVDLVAHTACAIGFSGLAYKTDEVKMVSIIGNEGGAPVVPSVESAIDGTYPIARPLYMYTNGEPTGAVKAYLDWILSDAGQRIIQAQGYAPVRKVD